MSGTCLRNASADRTRSLNRALFVAYAAFIAACGGTGGGSQEAFCATATRLESEVPSGSLNISGGSGGFIAYPSDALEELGDDAPGDLRDDMREIERSDDPSEDSEAAVNSYLEERCGVTKLQVDGGLLVLRTD